MKHSSRFFVLITDTRFLPYHPRRRKRNYGVRSWVVTKRLTMTESMKEELKKNENEYFTPEELENMRKLIEDRESEEDETY